MPFKTTKYCRFQEKQKGAESNVHPHPSFNDVTVD